MNAADLATVVIPTYNRGTDLMRTLGAVQRQTVGVPRVIVVDNASTDDTAARVAELQPAWGDRLQYLRKTPEGPAAARNFGLARATTPYVLFIDSDVELPPDWLALSLAFAQAEPAIAALGGLVLYAFDPQRINAYGGDLGAFGLAWDALEGRPLPVYGDGANIRDWIHVEDHAEALCLALLGRGVPGGTYCIGPRQERTNLQVVKAICAVLDRLRPDPAGPRERLITFVKDRPGHDFRYAMDPSGAERVWINCSAMLAHCDAVRAVGGFDERFFYGYEDTDLGWRLRLAGYRVTVRPELRVLHHVDPGVGEAHPQITFHASKNRFASLLRNASSVTLPWRLAAYLAFSAADLLLRGQRGARLRALAWNLRELPATWRLRRQTQAQRRCSDAQVFADAGGRWLPPSPLGGRRRRDGAAGPAASLGAIPAAAARRPDDRV